MTQPTPNDVNRVQRVIAYMIAAMVIVSVIAFVVILGAAYFGASGEFDRGVWPVVALVPLIALPLAVIGWIALLVVSLRARARDAAASSQGTRRGPSGTGSSGTGSRSGAAAAPRSPLSKAKGAVSKPKDPVSKPKSANRRRSRPS